MTANELYEKYLTFFKQHGHTEISGQSLIPENDPSVLFTTAGMHPLAPYILGQKHPAGKRLVNSQHCIRTGDIDEVGDDFHLTFFHMLGNWSLGDYFKEESIAMSYEFLISDAWLNISPDCLVISVFSGDSEVGRDNSSVNAWRAAGIPADRIFYLDRSHNWWGPVGKTGPCGPDTEMFIDTAPGTPHGNPGTDARYCEIWNNVFMEYCRNEDGSYTALRAPCVDTGMGLERTCTILQGVQSVYEIELFTPLIQSIVSLSAAEYKGRGQQSIRIIADHLRASCFILADKKSVLPSNVGQGYVLRRLIRRATRHLKKLGVNKPALYQLVPHALRPYALMYPNLLEKEEYIVQEIEREERHFMTTLDRGEREFRRLLADGVRGDIIPGLQAFRLYDTYGFPIELTEELAREHGLSVERNVFEQAFRDHQNISRKDQQARFSGGLADHSDNTTRLHTATHILQQALIDVLGGHVQQKGSNITHDRLRFDFSHAEKLTREQLTEVENIVNRKIQNNLPVISKTLTLAEAKEQGARALFTERYAEKVTVYYIGDYSVEVCGGPHVKQTGELGRFRIIKEQSSSRGVRRIKALLE